MSNRLAGEFALLAAAVLLGRGVWHGDRTAIVVESALWGGLCGWAAGLVAAAIIGRLAAEHAMTTATNERTRDENETTAS